MAKTVHAVPGDPRATFFPNRRVRVELSDWTPKLNTQGEKRLMLNFTLPLIDDARTGVLPDWLIHPLNSMEREGSVESYSQLQLSLDGITLEFWDVPKASERRQLITAANLTDFFIERVSRDKSSFLALTFKTNVKRTGLLSWCDKYERCWMWVEFTPADPAEKSKDHPGQQMTIGDAVPSPPPVDPNNPASPRPAVGPGAICGRNVGGLVCKLAPHGDDVPHELEDDFVEQDPADAVANLEQFKGESREEFEADRMGQTGTDNAAKMREANIAEANKANRENEETRSATPARAK